MITALPLFARGGASSTIQSRPLSDKLIGYSPMAPSTPATTTTTPGAEKSSTIPTAKDVTTAGGIWAPTSAKRDKIAELKAALTEIPEKQKPAGPFDATLDDLATKEQKLDLWLVDGLSAIARAVDSNPNVIDADEQSVWKEVKKWMTDVYKEKDDMLSKHQLEDYVRRFHREMERHLAQQTTQHPGLLKDVRDFLDVGPLIQEIEAQPGSSVQQTPSSFELAVQRYRLLLAQAVSTVLLESWDKVTKVSDHDIDRAAVEGVPLETQDSTIPLAKVEALLESYLLGNATTRVDAWWDLIDRDLDGLIQENEMNTVCELAIEPIGKALDHVLGEALEAHPVRLPPNDDGTVPEPKGWRQRRKESREKRKLQKMFRKTIKQHFQDEVEMAHRLRCIYAWANKAHQDNATKSVMVDEIAWTGRKRYVELPPKISLSEFREVQCEHFTHLDRVSSEYLKSFREDLWVIQGSGRQRSELIRDCAIFMAVVCGIDYVIEIN